MRVRSLSIRFILTAVIAVGVTFLLFIGVVYSRLEHSLASQATALDQISTDNLSALLTSDFGLAVARLKFLAADTARRVQSIAARSDTAAAIQSRNVVAISQLLQAAAANAEVDAIAVVDADLHVIGGSSDQMDLVGVAKIINSSPVRSRFVDALKDSVGTQPALTLILLQDELAPFLSLRTPPRAQFVFFEPLKDDFGEIAGALIAQRWLRLGEPTLLEFSKITKTDITLYAAGQLTSAAGPFAPEITVPPKAFTNASGGNEFIARCGPALERLELCALKPIAELYSAQHKLTEIGKAEGLKLVRWLGVVGLASSILLMLLLWLTARPITGPLRRLADTVGAIANRSYDVKVEGTQRQDEVGAIARAVAQLKNSVREIDDLRGNLVSQHSILQTREAELRTQN